MHQVLSGYVERRDMPGLVALVGHRDDVHVPELRRHILLAIAILRRPGAMDYLMELVASETEPTAIAALSALGIYKNDPRLRERIARLVHERGSPTLQAWFDRDFRLDEP
jgi:hypothetical protein